jgi:hypothetical protein
MRHNAAFCDEPAGTAACAPACPRLQLWTLNLMAVRQHLWAYFRLSKNRAFHLKSQMGALKFSLLNATSLT